jgi:hypothetical protein
MINTSKTHILQWYDTYTLTRNVWICTYINVYTQLFFSALLLLCEKNRLVVNRLMVKSCPGTYPCYRVFRKPRMITATAASPKFPLFLFLRTVLVKYFVRVDY